MEHIKGELHRFYSPGKSGAQSHLGSALETSSLLTANLCVFMRWYWRDVGIYEAARVLRKSINSI